MSLHAERERLSVIMADVDRWNAMPEEERARWLHQDKWGPYNKVASMLTPEECNILKTHKDPRFVRLREEFTKCLYEDKSSVDSVRKVTEMFFEVVRCL